jgi:hypothetical protein
LTEKNAFDRLKPVWPTLTTSLRILCDNVGKSAGGAYQVLANSVDNELSGSRSKPSLREPAGATSP